MALRIRVRCPTVSPTPIQLEGCTSQTTYRGFQSIILEALGLEEPAGGGATGLSILAGFPPRALDMADDAEIGSKLSDNENVTVRLANEQAAGIQQGGKWGRSKRAKASTATSSSTRSSPRASNPPSAAAPGATSSAGGAKGGKKADEKGASSNGRKRGGGTARGAVAGPASSSGAAGARARGGVHTLGGPLTPPAAARPRGGSGSRSGGGGGGGGGSGSPPGQVRTLFGNSGPTSGRAGGGSSAATAAAAAARRAGAPVGSSAAAAATASAGAGAEPDAVAAAAAAAAGDSSGAGPPRKRRRGGKAVQLKSEGDIAERLLTAVGGGGRGTADRFFRKAMKLAVDKQYDQSRADARVRAALGGWYTAETSATQRRLGDGESVALNISFSKGPGTKSQLTETVDRIPREQVAAVVRMIARDPESREMLKPHNFAGCSPRMFWSLVQHWGGDVPAALRLAAPDVDWSFVDTRDRKPSEKAVANAAAEEEERLAAEQERAEKERIKRKRERRKRRKEGAVTDSSEEEQEEVEEEEEVEFAEVVPAARGGDEASAAARAADARRLAANAALARLTASQQRPPTAAAGAEAESAATGETDRQADQEEEEEAEVDLEGLQEVAGEPGARLLVAAGVRTLGQLADRDEAELAKELEVLQQKQRSEGVEGAGGAAAESAAAAVDGGGGGSGNGSEGGSSGGEAQTVDAERVSEWVQSARGEELDEIMAGIVGDDEDVVEALEEVSVTTPRDLVRMAAFPDVLVEAVRDRLGGERFASLADRITAEAVELWRRKGDRMLEQRPWLELWVHGG